MIYSGFGGVILVHLVLDAMLTLVVGGRVWSYPLRAAVERRGRKCASKRRKYVMIYILRLYTKIHVRSECWH